jgi:ribonuclease Z
VSQVHAFALKAGHSTAHMAGAFAKRIRAKQLIITHFSARYDFRGIGSDGRSDVEGGMCTIQQLVSEAKKSMGSDNVIAAEDFLRFQVPRRDPAKSGRLSERC